MPDQFTFRRSLAVMAVCVTSALALGACGSSDKAGSGGSSAPTSMSTESSSPTGATSSATDASSSSASGGSSDEAPVTNGASQVKVTLTSASGKDTCTVDHTAAKAGPVTFSVQNVDSAALTEVELLSDQRILGEKENLAPGLPVSNFTVTLTGGTYQLYCAGGSPDTVTFTVTGQAASASSSNTQTLLKQGTTQYASYVTSTVGDLVTGVTRLKAAVDKGDVAGAKKAYALARPFYERIESDVDGFVLPGHKAADMSGNLDYLIDMRADSLDKTVGWHGFHAVERDLWQGGKITADTKKQAAELLTNVQKLQTLAKGLTYAPEDLANGAASLLEEVQSTKIKGTEDAFSHLDLVDFYANVEGAQEAFAYLKPGLEKIDPALTRQIAGQFASVMKTLNTYRDNSVAGGFKLWTPALRGTDAAKLSRLVQGLQAPLARLAEKVATAK